VMGAKMGWEGYGPGGADQPAERAEGIPVTRTVCGPWKT
jgi:hypothetical protein